MQTLSLLQLSDLHLDSRPGCERMRLPNAKAEQRRAEMRDVVANFCAEAVQRRVDLVLIPGDLFDEEAVSLETVAHAQEQLGGLAPMPVVIAPGARDPYAVGSPYDDAFLVSRGLDAWPDNVHVFKEPAWTTLRVAELEGVEVTGRAHPAQGAVEERVLAGRVPRGDAPIQLLLLHGTLESALPEGEPCTAPFTEEELLRQEFSYAALGHLHERTLVPARAASGRGGVARDGVAAAYAGCPAGRNLAESGDKAALHVLMEASPESCRVHVSPVRVDRRTVHALEIGCDGVPDRAAMIERIEERVRAADVQEQDIVHVRLIGTFVPGPSVLPPPEFGRDRWFHFSIDSRRLRPAYEFDKLLDERTRSTEARFARRLHAQTEGERDTERRRLLDNALYYGLDALVRNEVSPGYED